MVFYPEDHRLGKAEEVIILPILNEYFGRKISAYEEQTSKHDFYCDEYNYEVKSRWNTLKKYPTTMITLNKIAGDKKIILLFNFTDCLAYIEYSAEQFAKYEVKMFSRARIKSDEKEHIYIPIEDLTIIQTKIK